MLKTAAPAPRVMMDAFGRRIDYVRLSVTDRCDLRCIYCMREDQSFVPRSEVLSYETLETLIDGLIRRGVKTLRITGGEPLVRKDILPFLKRVGARLGNGLEALTLTTNGTQLAGAASALKDAGIQRINVSLDSLDPLVFSRLTRGGDLKSVLKGIETAQNVGLKVKLNTVVLRGENLDSLSELIRFAHDRDMAISLIETMPLDATIGDRTSHFVPLSDVVETLSSFWRLEAQTEETPGPSRYFRILETGGTIGLITPLSHNFCATCNRVRIDAKGRLFMCLGHDDFIDLRPALSHQDPETALDLALQSALAHKPKAHDFRIGGPEPGIIPNRSMSVTGG